MPVGHDEVGDNEDLGDGDLSDYDNLSDNVEQEELSSANAEEDLSPAPPRQRLRLLQRRRGKKAQTSPTFNVVTGRGGRGGAASPLGSPTRAPPGRGRGGRGRGRGREAVPPPPAISWRLLQLHHHLLRARLRLLLLVLHQ